MYAESMRKHGYTPPQVEAMREANKMRYALIHAHLEDYDRYVEEYRAKGYDYTDSYYYAEEKLKREHPAE